MQIVCDRQINAVGIYRDDLHKITLYKIMTSDQKEDTHIHMKFEK